MTLLGKVVPTQVSGEESGNIIVEIVEIHETDEPNLVAHLFDCDVLTVHLRTDAARALWQRVPRDT